MFKRFGPRWGHWGRHGHPPFFAAPPFGPRGGPPFGPPFGPPGGDPFGDDPFGHGPGRRRQRRGDIKLALLELLAERPRHGYELIKELESRFGGFYRPSPGSVYPTLQLLEDEGHLVSETVEGKRVYTITESGRKLLEERGPAEGRGGPGGFWGAKRAELHELRAAAGALMGVLAQVGAHGSAEQVRAAAARLDAVRRELYAILAEPAADPPAGEG